MVYCIGHSNSVRLSKYPVTTLVLLNKYSVTTLVLLSKYSVTTLVLLSKYSVTTLLLIRIYSVTTLLLIRIYSVTTLLLSSIYSVTTPNSPTTKDEDKTLSFSPTPTQTVFLPPVSVSTQLHSHHSKTLPLLFLVFSRGYSSACAQTCKSNKIKDRGCRVYTIHVSRLPLRRSQNYFSHSQQNDFSHSQISIRKFCMYLRNAAVGESPDATRRRGGGKGRSRRRA